MKQSNIKTYLTILATSLFFTQVAISNQYVYLKKPTFLSDTSYSWLSKKEDSDIGVLPTRLIISQNGEKRIITNGPTTLYDPFIYILNNSIFFKNEYGSFELNTETTEITEIRSIPEISKKVNIFENNNIKIGENIYFIDNNGIYLKSINKNDKYLSVFNAENYVADKNNKYLLITTEKLKEMSVIFIYCNKCHNKFVKVDDGKIGKTKIYKNDIYYLKNRNLYKSDLLNIKPIKTDIVADFFYIIDEVGHIYFSRDDNIYVYNQKNKKSILIISDAGNIFTVSKDEKRIVYEKNNTLIVYFINNNGLIGNNYVISTDYDSYEFIDNSLCILHTISKDYIPTNLPKIKHGTEIIILECQNIIGHPIQYYFLNTSFEIFTNFDYIQDNYFSFDRNRKRVIFTYRNMGYANIKIENLYSSNCVK